MLYVLWSCFDLQLLSPVIRKRWLKYEETKRDNLSEMSRMSAELEGVRDVGKDESLGDEDGGDGNVDFFQKKSRGEEDDGGVNLGAILFLMD